jgi:hypothetical protein
MGIMADRINAKLKTKAEPIAYHGSPYDFDEFHIGEHVGGGEGSMSYGYGTYLSTDKNDASGYKGKKDGKLYEVDIIPDDGLFLRWHDPINKQPKPVIDALEKVGLPKEWQTEMGIALYETIEERLGDQKKASEFLLSLGIKGIKYEWIDNVWHYVVFDEKDLKIRSKAIKTTAAPAVYHVAASDDVPAIMRDGLVPNRKGRLKNQMGGALSDKGKVYVFSDFDDAARWAFRSEFGTGKKQTILKIDENPASFETDTHFESAGAAGNWLKREGTIPPQKIVDHAEFTPEMASRISLNEENEAKGPLTWEEAMGGGMKATASSDAEYLAAAEAGDTAKCQAMVDQAAKAAGYTIGPVYHGSPNDFTEFDLKKARSGGFYGKGFYFTDSPSHALAYGNSYKTVFLKYADPLKPEKSQITRQQTIKFLKAVAEDEEYSFDNYGRGETPISVADKIYKNDAFAVINDVNASAIGNFAEAIGLFNKLNGTKYDAVVTPTETVVYRPEQIKSADPITRDDAGNIIPLSKRFNSASNDIRANKEKHTMTRKDDGRSLKAKAAPNAGFNRWRVWWIDPETKKKSLYQDNLSQSKAQDLVHNVKYVISPRNYGYNAEVWAEVYSPSLEGNSRPHTVASLDYLSKQYKALKAAGRISATGRAEEILAEDDWVRVKRMAVPEIDADSYIFTECKRETAVCIVRNSDGFTYLMRNEATLQSNFTPAPKVMTETLEEGETAEQAATRGLLEEFNGAPVEPLIYLGSINGTFQELHNYHIFLADGDFLMASEDFDGDGSRGEDRSNNVTITEEDWAQVKDFISWIAFGMMKQYDNRNILGRAVCR